MVTFLDTTCHARPGLRGPPALTYSDGTGTVRADRQGRAARRGGRGAAHRPRHAGRQAQRRGGLVRRRAAAGGRGGVAAAAQPLPRVRDRRGDRPLRASTPPASARPCATPAGSASPPTRSRAARSASSAPGRACRSTTSTATRSTASSCGASSTTPASRSRACRRCCASCSRPAARSTTRRSATCSAWDELCRTRRVVAIGGLDAHQFGKRIGPVVPLRLMGYHRSFRLHPHARAVRAAADRRARARPRAGLRGAARRAAATSRSTRSRPARGFRFEADDLPMGAEAPAGPAHADARARRWTPSCGCCATAREIAGGAGRALETRGRGARASTASRRCGATTGRERTWILSNPIYLRDGST